MISFLERERESTRERERERERESERERNAFENKCLNEKKLFK